MALHGGVGFTPDVWSLNGLFICGSNDQTRCCWLTLSTGRALPCLLPVEREERHSSDALPLALDTVAGDSCVPAEAKCWCIVGEFSEALLVTEDAPTIAVASP